MEKQLMFSGKFGKTLFNETKNHGDVMLAEATIKKNKFHDIAHWGIRAAIGSIFI